MLKLMVGVVIATVIVIFAFSVINNNVGPGSNIGPSIQSVDENYLTITVTGQVVKPGSYVVRKDSTVGDLILSAGGVTTNADARAYIEETEIIKGTSYYIAPINDLNDYCGEKALEKYNVNEATREDLMKIKGVGSQIATDIITYRNENGPFTYLEELQKVRGIGKSTFESIKNNVILR